MTPQTVESWDMLGWIVFGFTAFVIQFDSPGSGHAPDIVLFYLMSCDVEAHGRRKIILDTSL